MKILVLNFIIFFCYCGIISDQAFSQQFNFKNDSVNKNWISVNIGGHYADYFGERYHYPPNCFQCGDPFVGFWNKSSFNLNFGVNIIKQYKNFIFKISLNYFNRKRIFKSDSNEIKKYTGSYGFQYENIIKYTISPNNIELSLGLGYSLKKNFILGELNISSNFYYRNVLIDKYNNRTIEHYSIFSDKYFCPFYFYEHRINFIPSIIYYRSLNKNLSFFIGFDYFQHYYSVQTGVNIKFNQNKK